MVSIHPAQASPIGSVAGRAAGSIATLAPNRRAQWVCTRRSAAWPPGVPCPASAITARLRIALRVTLTHVSHSCGVCGSWSACSSNPRQSGQRPCCACSRRSRDRSSGGLRRRRLLAQYSASAGSSGDAQPLTCWCRTICVQANLARKAPLSRSPKIHLSCLVCECAEYRVDDPPVPFIRVTTPGPAHGQLPHMSVQMDERPLGHHTPVIG